MGSGKHIDSNERYIVYRKGIWGCKGNAFVNTVATGIVYSLWTSGLSRNLPDLSSYGSGLERPYRRYMW